MSPSNRTPASKPVTLHRPPEQAAAGTLDHRPEPSPAAGVWAVAVILPYPLPPRLPAQPQPGDLQGLPEPTCYIGDTPIFGPPPYGNGEDDYAALYAPPEACFVLAIDPNAQTGSFGSAVTPGQPLRWQDVEIVLRSPHAWTVDATAPLPPATPALIAFVHELARRAQALGWEPISRGPHWYSLRFRRSWTDLGGTRHRG